MSELVWYSFNPPPKHSGLNVLIEWLSFDIKLRYYVYRLCCNSSNIDLPRELWIEIVYLMCETKKLKTDILSENMWKIIKSFKILGIKSPIEPQELLHWYDNYICNPEIQKFNPALLNEHISDIIIYNYGYQIINTFLMTNHEIDTLDISLGNTDDFSANGQKITILHNGDVFLGIEKNTNIKSIKFIVYFTKLLEDPDLNDQWVEYTKSFEYTINTIDLTEFTLTSYSHDNEYLVNTYKEYVKEHLYDLEYKNKDKTFWTFRKIMPIFLPCLYDKIELQFEFNDNNIQKNINVLYGFMDIDYRYNIFEHMPLTYNNLVYSAGHLKLLNPE